MARFAVDQIYLTDTEGKPALSEPVREFFDADEPDEAVRLFILKRGGTLITEPSSFRSWSAFALARFDTRYVCVEATISDEAG